MTGTSSSEQGGNRDQKALREMRQRVLSELKAAVEAAIGGSPTDTGLALQATELAFAHQAAIETGTYDVFEGEDPVTEATHAVVRGLLPKIEDQMACESVHPGERSGQAEVSGENLKWMADHILAHPELPADKISRWLGFIQGVLAVRGRLSVAEERDETRAIFHKAYRRIGLAPPRSASMQDHK